MFNKIATLSAFLYAGAAAKDPVFKAAADSTRTPLMKVPCKDL
jgi:hypothetical protein